MPRNGRFALMFAAAVLAVVAVIVLVTQIGDEDDGADEQAVATAPANVPAATGPLTTGTGDGGHREGTGTTDAEEQPSLTAGGTDLLPLPDGGLERFDGEEVQGRRLVVVAVSEDGFSVGRREDDPERVRVEHGSSYAPQTGDRVDLRGVVDGSAVRAESVLPEGDGRGAGGDADGNSGEKDRP